MSEDKSARESRAEPSANRKRPRFDEAMANVTQEMVEDHFHLPLREAAEEFGVCITFFKKICRALGIKRWPHRKVAQIHKLHKRLGEAVPDTSVGALQEIKKREEEEANGNGDRERVPVWDKVKKRKLAGMAAPLKHRLRLYLFEHPNCEVYDGQDGKSRSSRAKPELRSRAAPEENEDEDHISIKCEPSEDHRPAKRARPSLPVGPLDVSPSLPPTEFVVSDSSCGRDSLSTSLHNSLSSCDLSARSHSTLNCSSAESAPMGRPMVQEWFPIPIDQPWDETVDEAEPPVLGRCVADFVDKLDDCEFSQFVDAIGDSWAAEPCGNATL